MQYATLMFRDYKGNNIISGITQVSREGTHINLAGANDWNGVGATDRVDLLAPCDVVVRAIARGDNTVFFESLEEVMTPSGKSKIWLMCTHLLDSDYSLLGMKVGKVFKQGTPIYTEGNKGIGSGYHIHMEQGLGVYKGAGSPYYKSTDTFKCDGKVYAQYYPCMDGKEISIDKCLFIGDCTVLKRQTTGKGLYDLYPNAICVTKAIEEDNARKDVASKLENLKAKEAELEKSSSELENKINLANKAVESIKKLLV